MRTSVLWITLAASLASGTVAAAAVIGTMSTPGPITEARIATLPQAQQAAWHAYLAHSRALMAADKAELAKERGDKPFPAAPEPGPSGGGGMPLDRPAEWYASAEARHVADTIVSFQTPAGGWGKNMDRAGPARLPGQNYVPIEDLPPNAREDIKTTDPKWTFVGTIDNNATTSELRFLARVQARLPGQDGAPYRRSFEHGITYLLAAQFPNGGWPQVYPLQGGYHDALTFNDDALSQVTTLLSAVASRQGDYAFVPTKLACDSGAAVQRAVEVILTTQVKADGQLTVWGQQHDALTLAPVGARNFEPIALSSDESADLLIYLMAQPDPSPRMKAAIRAGVAWLTVHELHDVQWVRDETAGRKLISTPGAAPLWARYYDVQTGKPVFGDRDKTIHDDVSEISLERRKGYSWYNAGPAKALAKFQAWTTRYPS